MPSNKPIKVVYHQAGLVSSEEWSSVEFPSVSEAAMIKLLDVCSVASYGYKGKVMVDKNCQLQKTFKLASDRFTIRIFPNICCSYFLRNPVNSSYSSWPQGRII